MAELTDSDHEQALALAERLDGAIGPATQLKILERFLAEQREELTRVDLTDEPGPIDVSYASQGHPIDYTLTLPSGHAFRLAAWQVRELLREAHLALGENP